MDMDIRMVGAGAMVAVEGMDIRMVVMEEEVEEVAMVVVAEEVLHSCLARVNERLV